MNDFFGAQPGGSSIRATRASLLFTTCLLVPAQQLWSLRKLRAPIYWQSLAHTGGSYHFARGYFAAASLVETGPISQTAKDLGSLIYVFGD